MKQLLLENKASLERIDKVVEKLHKKMIWNTIGSILKIILIVAPIILGVIYLVISQILPSMGSLWIVLFIWQQIYILSKMWTRVLFFSTEYHFYRS